VYGRAHELTPCLELPLTEVSGPEAAEYKAFVQDYNQYWRTYFDPIAVRIQVSPQRHRLETLVPPLVDNSVYTILAQTVGGPTVPLEPLPVARRTIASFAVHLNKQPALEMLGPDVEAPAEAPPPGRSKAVFQSANELKQIGLAMHNYHDANGH